MQSQPGYEALRRFRHSRRGLSHFVTICTEKRLPGLNENSIAAAIRHELDACTGDRYWRVQGAVIMHDHFHLLEELTGDLSLGRIIARVKAKTRNALAAHGLSWQGNFYEHRMRENDSVEDVLRYLFLNPYLEKIVPMDKAYPWFWLHPEEAVWFKPTLNKDHPFPEWLC